MTPFPPATRVACYPRVSTEEQKLRGLSIEDQTVALRAWAERNGMRSDERRVGKGCRSRWSPYP